MATRAETVRVLDRCFDEIEQLTASLTADDWAVPSLCPAWDVAGVVRHLAAVEHILSGWLPEGDDITPPFGAIAAFDTEAAAWDPDRLAEEARRIFAGRRTELAAMTDEQFGGPSMTPVGPGTYHRFMEIRIFDFWVHARDITTPLGRAGDDGGPAAEISVDEVEGSIGYIVGKKVGLPDGMSIAFHLTGPVTRDIYAAVDGRAARVDGLTAPSVEVTTDSLTFVQLACGRTDPQDVIDAGRISWTGDAEWGERAARNLRFTM